MGKIKQYITVIRDFAIARPWTTVFLAALIAGGATWYFLSKPGPVAADFAVVRRGTVSQVVSVTGKVKPAQEVKLSFEKSGRVAQIYRGVGERVETGAWLVSLENGDLFAQLAQAKATTKAQTAKLAELKNGARPEDIFVSEVDVESAVNDAVNNIKNAYVSGDDAIRNKVDQFMSNPKSTMPQINFVVSNSQLKNEIENGRSILEESLNLWNSSLGGLGYSNEVNRPISEAKDNLRAVGNYLDKIAIAVNALTANSTITQTTVDAYKAAIFAGRTNVTSSLDSLITSEEKLRAAQAKLALKKAGIVKEQIDAQEAEVEGAEASIKNLEAQIAKTVIRSPISGVVTKQDAKQGEIASAGAILTSVISDSKYEIEANVPESDIAKIKIGDRAEVTLDAYGSDIVFGAAVAEIDPAETIIDGVATYRTTLQFGENDARIKPGMTANTDISGQKKENVLFMPGRAVSIKEKVKTVDLLEGDITREVIVTTGLRGSNGDVEILSGLKEGDKVRVSQ